MKAVRREGRTPSVIYGDKPKPSSSVDIARNVPKQPSPWAAPERLSSRKQRGDQPNRREKEPTRDPLQQAVAQLRKQASNIKGYWNLSSAELVEALKQVIASFEAPNDTLPLPTKAPELWAERHGRNENPVAFIRRVYAPWISKGLIRPHIKDLDPPLYNALGVWCHRNPDDALPELPTLSEHIDKIVADLSHRYSEDELRKLGMALQMRHRKSVK